QIEVPIDEDPHRVVSAGGERGVNGLARRARELALVREAAEKNADPGSCAHVPPALSSAVPAPSPRHRRGYQAPRLRGHRRCVSIVSTRAEPRQQIFWAT